MAAEPGPKVSILMGSDSDLPIMGEAAKVLRELGIPFELEVTSAHRSPDRSASLVKEAPARGVRVFIVGAGAAAHLAGAVAALTTLPVLGVPLPSSELQGLDALLATVQMPAGVPVGTLAIGKAGAANAALLAAQILALADDGLAERLAERKRLMADGIERKSTEAKRRLADLLGPDGKGS
jgi:phosphoribosylaminoimidazole carboxylase PurE protein